MTLFSIFFLDARASNETMTKTEEGTIRKVNSGDLKVGRICADRDGNRVRIDRVDPQTGTMAYHFLNDELRVQEGVREVAMAEFIAEGWYLA